MCYTFSRICSGVDIRFTFSIDVITGRVVTKATGRGHIETDEQLLNEVIDGITRGTGVVVKARSFVVKVGRFIVFSCKKKVHTHTSVYTSIVNGHQKC